MLNLQINIMKIPKCFGVAPLLPLEALDSLQVFQSEMCYPARYESNIMIPSAGQ